MKTNQIVSTLIPGLLLWAALFLCTFSTASADFSGLTTRNGVSFSVNNYGLYSYNSLTDFSPLHGSNECIPDIEPSSDFTAWEMIEPDVSEYLETFDSITTRTVLGESGEARGYVVGLINLIDEESLTIIGDVTLLLEGDINVKGLASIIVESEASLKIYTEHDVEIAGKGIENVSLLPRDFIVYGTAIASENPDSSYDDTQNIEISGGNGQLAAAIYAPNANVSVHSGIGGGFAGAIRCHQLSVLTYWYSVDESLGEVFPFGLSDESNLFDQLSTAHQIFEGSNEFSLTWNSTYAATYQVERTFSLDLPFEEIPGAKLSGTGNTMTWSDLQETHYPQSFYRVTVKQID